MTVALLYYDGFAEFEIVLVGLLFKRRHDILSIALEDREYVSEEGQRYRVDKILHDVDPDAVDLLVIPGGNPAALMESRDVRIFLERLAAGNKKIGGICGGAGLLAGLGLLRGRKCTGGSSGVKPGDSEFPYFTGALVSEEHVVVDGNIVTAQGQAYVEFAVELARQTGLYANPEEYDADLKWCKNIR